MGTEFVTQRKETFFMPKNKTFDELIPVQLKLERYQADALRKKAKEGKVSMSALIRKYIDEQIIDTLTKP
jgi:hypothetical protein